jgi:hypothetical protein
MDSSRAPGLAAGTVIGGRYTVESLLGRGGMATVYRAIDVPLGRSVAVKVFSIDSEGTAGLGRESSEIQLLASLNHHALVTLFDANVDTGDGVDHSFLVMELVEGPTLKERIESGPIAELDVAQMVVDLAEALHVVHGNGVVHRDVKPANILLNPSVQSSIEFRAKLSDFGIAYLIDSTRLTMPGTIIGTAAYLSPEQARGVAPGSPSDIYSLGLVALEALTGARAFEGSMIESLSARLVSDPVIPGTLDAEWRALLGRMTDRDAEARPTALEVVEIARRIEREMYAATDGLGTQETQPFGAADLLEATRPIGATEALGATAALGATEALGETEALGATSALGATAALGETAAQPSGPLEPTRAFGQPTRVMPAPSEGETVVLNAPAAAEPAAGPAAASPKPSKRRVAHPRRVILAVAAVLVALTVGGFAWNSLATDGSSEVAPPALPENGGALGIHLEQLMESVTP